MTPKQRTGIVLMILLLAVGFMAACSTVTPTQTPTLTPTTATALTPTVSKDTAVEAAIAGCKIPHFVLVGDPQNIRAKLMPLEEADLQMKAPGEYTHYDQPPDYPVWLVQMDGQLQLVGGPLAVITKDGQLIAVTPTPSQPYWGTCTVFIDALSGSVIAVYN